ncbi:DUF7604 domain-containing protein [Bifidobacterium lemurum]|nr:VWA domain-containing protein [Bifidobacterium lemurum]QOL35284.1 VWA domain-containing protein [Bifidobacterium lemurum]
MGRIRELLARIAGAGLNKAMALVAALAMVVSVVGVGTAVAEESSSSGQSGTAQTAETNDETTKTDEELAAEADDIRPAESTDDGVAAASDDDVDLEAPAHRKYIKDNGDGTYWLSLDVTGASRASTEQNYQAADVVLVMDTSGSMNDCVAYDRRGNCTQRRWGIATSAASALANQLLTDANAALPTNQQVQMAVVDFDTTSKVMDLSSRWGAQSWTTSASAVTSSFDDMSASGGTNWEAGLSDANSLNSSRAGVKKYIIFLSDGSPTFRNSSMGVRCPNGWNSECNYYGSDGVYGTGSSDDSGYNYNAAVNEANSRNGAELYVVSTGSGANDDMSRFANDVNGTFFDGTDEEKLTAAFDSIIEEITRQSTYRDVLVKDTLSQYAVATDSQGGTGYLVESSAYDADGGDVSQTDPAARSMSVEYNQETKELSMVFPEGTTLSPNVTYVARILIKPSDDAYDYFIANSGSYPNTGDANTDAEGNTTSSNQAGFYANATNGNGDTSATVYYKVVTTVDGEEHVGEEQSALYDRPVIQVKVPSLTLSKSVDSTYAGDYGAQPANWTLSALKNSGAYGINPTTPSGDVSTDGFVSTQSVSKTLLAPGIYTLSEAEDESTGYQYFNGYTAGRWKCVDADGDTVTVSTSGSSGAQTVNLKSGDDVTCTVTNTALPGAIFWKKVDQRDQTKLLEGSQWTLSGDIEGFEELNIVDDGENDQSSDTAGELSVDGLVWGEYTLTETKAPTGYRTPTGDDAEHAVSVLPSNGIEDDGRFVIDVGSIVNKRTEVSSLPLTGGMSERDWLIGGAGLGMLALLLIGGVGIWRGRQRLL